MRAAMFALAIFLLFDSFGTLEQMRSRTQSKASAVLSAEADGEFFLAYRDAVRTFVATNPAFTGTVSNAQIAALGFAFPSSFYSVASNRITPYGSAGRMITSYASLPPGARAHAYEVAEFDASLGVSNGSTWTSVAPGATPQALPASITAGSIVSVSVSGK